MLNNRSDSLRPIGLFAFHFFQKGWNCAFHLVISDWTLTELKKYASEADISELLGYFKERDKLIIITCSPQDIALAKKSLHWQDALHTIIAERSGCAILVTRNVADFSSSKVDIARPESI
ncbi:MAG: hypothetical protein WC884_04305 [Candidatus Paceibacterota bacterium]